MHQGNFFKLTKKVIVNAFNSALLAHILTCCPEDACFAILDVIAAMDLTNLAKIIKKSIAPVENLEILLLKSAVKDAMVLLSKII